MTAPTEAAETRPDIFQNEEGDQTAVSLEERAARGLKHWTAVHESGHAVACLILSPFALESVSTEAGAVSLGHASIVFGRVADFLDRAVIFLAGPIAAHNDWPLVPSWSSNRGDIAEALRNVFAAIGGLHRDDIADNIVASLPALRLAQRVAADLVREYQAEISAGADALLNAPGMSLSAAEFAAACGGRFSAIAGQLQQVESATAVYLDAAVGTINVAHCQQCSQPLPIVASWVANAAPGEMEVWIAAINRAELCHGLFVRTALGSDDE